MTNRQRWSVLLALLLLWLTPGMARAEEKPGSFPKALQFTQSIGLTNPRKDVTLIRIVPHTGRKDVNAALKAVMDDMEKAARAYYPTGRVQSQYTRVTIGPSIYRSGTRWLSFLTTCTVDAGTERAFLDFDARVYDMESGAQLTLCDLFPSDSAAWAVLQAAVRTQLTGYFRELEPDAAALERLCTREAIEQAAFTVTAGRLVLHYRADALYPGKDTLMHVKLWLDELWDMMTDTAREQTDNRIYKLVALTFDDGCAGVTSMGVINLLRQYGANATFFVVGESMADNHYVLKQEHDTGFTVASHNYVHDTSLTPQPPEVLRAWKTQYDEAMDAIIGITPAFMRTPGGMDEAYQTAEVGLPLIHWSMSSNDAVAGTTSEAVYRRVVNTAGDRQVILMHDGRSDSPSYVREILPILMRKGVMCVTVEELFHMYGVELEPNQVYWYPAAQE